MFRLAADVQVYLHCEGVDFWIGINGLAIFIEQEIHPDPFGRAVFAFCNRRRDRIRLLPSPIFDLVRVHVELLRQHGKRI